MAKRPKFKPVITRVKLNPEQAVLACSCSGNGVTSVTSFDDVNGYCAGPPTRRDIDQIGCIGTTSAAMS